MVKVEHTALEKIQDPMLETALQRWYQLCGQEGLYRQENLGFWPLSIRPGPEPWDEPNRRRNMLYYRRYG